MDFLCLNVCDAVTGGFLLIGLFFFDGRGEWWYLWAISSVKRFPFFIVGEANVLQNRERAGGRKNCGKGGDCWAFFG